jgi:hypothetical protein
MPDSIGKAPNHSFEIGEHSIAPLLGKFILTVVALVSLAGSVMAQQPSSGLQDRTIKTLSAEQIADLSAGRGMGFALAADLPDAF